MKLFYNIFQRRNRQEKKKKKTPSFKKKEQSMSEMFCFSLNLNGLLNNLVLKASSNFGLSTNFFNFMVIYKPGFSM